LDITTRTSQDESANSLHSEFGELGSVQSKGGSIGTRIIVQRLFENTPARLKFLKSDTAEHTQIKNILKGLALANPQVGFRIRQKGKLLFMWPSCEAQERCEQVLDFSPLYFGESEVGGLKASIYVGAPNKTVKTSRQIFTFVQSRIVQDRSLQAAVMDAYRSLLMHGEYPVACIFVEAPKHEVDVNIHPTKSQVKFENASNAFRVVLRSVRSVLESAPWVKDLKPSTSGASPYVKESIVSPESTQVEMLYNEPVVYKTKSIQREVQKSEALNPVTSEGSSNLISQIPAHSEMNIERAVRSEEPVIESDVATGFFSSLHVVGQAHLTYIIAQSSEAMIIVDQHAAHERVMYEKLMAHWKNGNLDIQQFLIPLTVDLDSEQVEAIVNYQSEVEKLGLEIDQAGPETLAVRAAPNLLREKSIAAALEVLGRELIEVSGSFAVEKTISDVCATMACHSVIRAGQSMSREEMISLLKQMDEFPLSSFCPHGRPVYVEYPFNKLERDFGRIV